MRSNYFDDIGAYVLNLQSLDRIFQDWGYKPILVPLIDSFEPYKELLEEEYSDCYKFLDTNGDLMLLRSDSTLFLARMASTHLNNDSSPLRLSYTNSVIQPSKTINNDEIYQSGIELFGVNSIAGDFEVILLIMHSFNHIAPQKYKLHIGSRAIVSNILQKYNQSLSPSEINTILQLIGQRQHSEVSKYMSRSLMDLLFNIMDLTEFNEKRDIIASFLTDESIFSNYCLLVDALSSVASVQNIRCDFSETGTHNYYSDIVFSVYADDCASVAAQGGRYDRILQYFDLDFSAVGATLYPHIIRPYLSEYNYSYPNTKIHSTTAFDALSDLSNPTVKDLVQCANVLLERT